MPHTGNPANLPDFPSPSLLFSIKGIKKTGKSVRFLEGTMQSNEVSGADFGAAVRLTLQHEGGFYHNPVTGEIVNHGITLKFIHESGYNPAADEAFIRNLTTQQAHSIYQKYFWDRCDIGGIFNQDLANKVFDLAVNMGPGGALKPLAEAVSDCGRHCAIDGVLTPAALAQINALDAAKLLAAYRARARKRYQAIAAANPKLAGDLPGWLARLDS
jgi:lysozyme family protein